MNDLGFKRDAQTAIKNIQIKKTLVYIKNLLKIFSILKNALLSPSSSPQTSYAKKLSKAEKM